MVEHGGFSAAERATDIPKSKLSRRVYNLEEHLGVRLIQRSSRHFAVTEIGMNIYRHAQVMMNAAQAAHDLVDHLSTQPRGVIKVSLPVSIAQNEIAKILPQFLKTYPEIRIQLIVSNRRVDIINEGIDVALRVRSTLDDDPSLILRKFEKIEQHLFFISYVKIDTIAETKLLFDFASKKFGNNVSIFQDTNERFKLDELVKHVRASKNVVIFLSQNFFMRCF